MTTISTVENLRSLFQDEGKAVLIDSGGFVWWTVEDETGYWLAGVAEPARKGTHGTAIQAWMNLMTPEQAAAYGPFTIIHRSDA